jgi:membrane protease YdiL (CAAX protease family)
MQVRLACWTALVLGLAGLGYASRFSDGGGGTSQRDAVYSYANFANGAVLYGLWLGLVLLIASGRWDLLALRRPRSWGRAGGISVAVIVGIYAVSGLVTLLPIQNPGDEQGLTPTRWEPHHAGAFAANIVLFAVIAPVVEELTFRGLGQSLLRAFLGRWPSIVLVGVAFGIAHGLVGALTVLVPFGIALAYLRDRTDSVYPGIVVHGLFNGIALAASVVSVPG